MPAAPPPAYGGMPTPPPVYPPAGYTAYGPASGVPTVSTSGVRKATIVLFWATTAAMAVLGFVAYQRGGVADDLFHGEGTFSDLDDADARLGGAVLLVAALQIAAAIVLAVWSSRTVSNAKRRGADASSGLAAGGWFIPIGWYWVPWTQIRKSTRPFGTAPGSLGLWQLLFAAQTVLSIAARATVGSTIDLDEDAAGKLHTQGILFLVTAALLVVTTVAATKAMKDVDALTSPSS
jgi:hypothetical protein